MSVDQQSIWDPEVDFGTPAIRDAESVTQSVTVTIDGRQVDVPAGTSVLRAATEAGVTIPKLCATDSLKAFGSCRMCLVEVEGGKGVPASCTTPCADGMVVSTQTETVRDLRRNVMELYLSDHPEDCDGCARGNCEIQALAATVGSAEVRYGRPESRAQVAHPQPIDLSNPYFAFDDSACIVCSRCVRACADIQGTFALTVEGRGFDSKISAGGTDFLCSECVSCGACVQACPTSALQEHSVVELGMPTRSVDTTCAYCGVGCSFRAEVKGEGDDAQVVRMMPSKDGGANEGHSCVKGRFAYGYASHQDRQMLAHGARLDRRRVAQGLVGRGDRHGSRPASVDPGRARRRRDRRHLLQRGAPTRRCTSSRRWCGRRSATTTSTPAPGSATPPPATASSQTFGTSAGTQDFASVEQADVILLIGANPTDAHPVFASRMKKRLRAGAELIVADPRRIDLVRSPHVEAAHHLPLLPGSNVAFINAMAHVIVTEGLHDEEFLRERCEDVEDYLAFIARPEQLARGDRGRDGHRPATSLRAAARLYAEAPNAAIYYGLGVTEHSQGSTMVMGMANLAMITGNIGREGVGVNPLRGQNNVQGSCDMGSFPHEFPGYRHVGRDEVRGIYEELWGKKLDPEPGLRIPNMFDSALAGTFRGLYVQGEDIAQSDPNINHVHAALRAMDLVVVQDLFLNETARFAHVFLPGTTFLEKDGTFTNAERRLGRVRPVFQSRVGKDEWEVVCDIATAMGFPMSYDSPAQIMDEIAATTPTFAGVTFARLDAEGSMQWPVNDAAPHGTPTMHIGEFVRGKGHLVPTWFVPTTERTSRKFPLLLTTGRILTQYNVGAQTRRTSNNIWHPEDVLEIHPADAEMRGISTGDLVDLSSRVGSTTLRAQVSERMPAGVVYTTFHHPVTGANVVTTENSDWATNCPEYKVTAVQVGVANARGDEAVAEAREPAETHA